MSNDYRFPPINCEYAIFYGGGGAPHHHTIGKIIFFIYLHIRSG